MGAKGSSSIGYEKSLPSKEQLRRLKQMETSQSKREYQEIQCINEILEKLNEKGGTGKSG